MTPLDAIAHAASEEAERIGFRFANPNQRRGWMTRWLAEHPASTTEAAALELALRRAFESDAWSVSLTGRLRRLGRCILARAMGEPFPLGKMADDYEQLAAQTVHRLVSELTAELAPSQTARVERAFALVFGGRGGWVRCRAVPFPAEMIHELQQHTA